MFPVYHSVEGRHIERFKYSIYVRLLLVIVIAILPFLSGDFYATMYLMPNTRFAEVLGLPKQFKRCNIMLPFGNPSRRDFNPYLEDLVKSKHSLIEYENSVTQPTCYKHLNFILCFLSFLLLLLLSICVSLFTAFSLLLFPISFFPHKSDIDNKADSPVTFHYSISNFSANTPASYSSSVGSNPDCSV